MALDASIGEKPYGAGYSPKATRKTRIEESKRKHNSAEIRLKRKQSHWQVVPMNITQSGGTEIGVIYDFSVEDVITGLAIHYRGWKSVNSNPLRLAFISVGPTTLNQTILQHKRFSKGNFSIFLSKYCPFLFGHGKIRLLHQIMGYSIYGLWAPNSLPTLFYVTIPSIGLVKGTQLFPEVVSKKIYSPRWCGN